MSFEVRLVNSEFIALVAYNPTSKTLRIITYKGATVAGFDYLHVPARIFQSLSTAPSVGSVFNKIKGHYSFQRLDPTETFTFYRNAIAATANTRVIVD